MAVYNVSYDLNSPGQRYDDLRNEIKSLGPWCTYLESTFLVKSALTVQQIENKLAQHLDSSDRMLICKVEKPIGGWLSDDEWKWIKAHM